MNITELFKQQIESGAKDNFFYGTEMNGEVSLEFSPSFSASKIRS